MVLNRQISDKQFIIFEFSLIILSVLFPLLIDLPYRVNIFLTWEGTYRMYLGQMPYKDFGIPLGYGFFLIPLLFFKIFGPYLHTLVLAQVLINFISLLAFRNILKILGVNHSQRSLSLLVFCLSYSFFNFWPWYNHSVFVFQMVGFNFLLLSFFTTQKAKSYLWLFIASVFIFLAFFTKQDSGGLAIIFAGILLSYIAWLEKKIPLFILYCLSIFLIGVFFIGPLLPYDFSYWFNYGQAPHSSRLHVIDFLNKILGNSNWEKLYIGIIGIIFIRKIENFRVFIHDKKEVLFFLITIGVIVQSLIVKVTSPLPTDHQSYFHGFAFAYIFWNIRTGIQWNTYKYALASFAFVFFWWSALYWDYFGRLFPLPPAPTTTGLVAPPPPPSKPWVTSNYVSMAKIKMPPGTIDGIEKLINLEEVKNK